MWTLLLAFLVIPVESAQNSFHGIRGVVTDLTRQPIPAAVVVLVRVDSGEQQKRGVDENGTFAFDCLANGEYRITFSSAGFLTSSIEAIRYHYPDDLNLTVLMNFEPVHHNYIWPGYAVVVQSVDSVSHAPIDGAEIEVSRGKDNSKVSGSTDKCGKLSLFLDPGEYVLSARKSGFQPENMSLNINGSRDVTLELKRANPK